jgi:hypothetical protein
MAISRKNQRVRLANDHRLRRTIPRPARKAGLHDNPSSPTRIINAMSNLSAFPITAKWPAQHPERLQL